MPSFDAYLERDDVQQRAASFAGFLKDERQQYQHSGLDFVDHAADVLDAAEVQHAAWTEWSQVEASQEEYNIESLNERSREKAHAMNTLRGALRRALIEKNQSFINFLSNHNTFAADSDEGYRRRQAYMHIVRIYNYAQNDGLLPKPQEPARPEADTGDLTPVQKEFTSFITNSLKRGNESVEKLGGGDDGESGWISWATYNIEAGDLIQVIPIDRFIVQEYRLGDNITPGIDLMQGDDRIIGISLRGDTVAGSQSSWDIMGQNSGEPMSVEDKETFAQKIINSLQNLDAAGKVTSV